MNFSLLRVIFLPKCVYSGVMSASQDIKNRVKKLANEINYHRYLYHVLNRQEISDAALDSLKHELSTIEKEHPALITPNSPTQRVAGHALAGFKKIKHKTPMLSLNDAFSEEEVNEWEQRIKKLASDAKPDYFAELKIDGFAVSLTYTNGFFTKGSTRGDGNVGEDVTVNLKTIESIPLELQSLRDFENIAEVKKILHKFPRVRAAVTQIPQRLEIRGEV
ncbi:MAG: hypothetical protein AAB972_03305, partial [Patescibacteria group bacterium]